MQAEEKLRATTEQTARAVREAQSAKEEEAIRIARENSRRDGFDADEFEMELEGCVKIF